MAITKSYANYLGDKITEQQFNNLTESQINYYENNLIIKTEHFEGDKIILYTIYTDDQVKIPSILNEYPGKVDVIVRSFSAQYRIEELFNYNNSILYNNSKHIYDQKNNLLCDQYYDLLGDIKFESTEKYLYDGDEELFALAFSYKSDGSVNSIWGTWVLNTDQGQKGSIYDGNILTYFPTLFIDHPYYQNATPFLPNSPTV